MRAEDSGSEKLNLLQVAKSVVAAAFGVQSQANRERDFTRGSAKVFIVAGIIGTIVFVLTVWLAVKLILKAATG